MLFDRSSTLPNFRIYDRDEDPFIARRRLRICKSRIATHLVPYIASFNTHLLLTIRSLLPRDQTHIFPYVIPSVHVYSSKILAIISLLTTTPSRRIYLLKLQLYRAQRLSVFSVIIDTTTGHV
jgi:hypothetical protein